MIRDKFRKEIISTIDNHSRFDSTDFKIETVKDQKGATVLTIRYSLELKYKISFRIPTSTTEDTNGYSTFYAFSGSVCPGPLAYEETFTFKGETTVFTKITTWLNSIWEEISSNPLIKQMENQQHQIDEIFEKFENIKDGYFTVDEADELRRRLDELEISLKEQIEKSDSEVKKYEEEVEKLHTDIDTLKETINSFSKKGWLKSFATKIFKWSSNSENRKMLKDGYSVIKELLPENIKNSLPE